MQQSRLERFLVCPNGSCNVVLALPSKRTQTLSALQPRFACPICNFQVLNVRDAETGRSHKICPYCFNHPPQDLHPGQTELRCFQCAHPTCGLAGGRGVGANNGNGGGGGGNG